MAKSRKKVSLDQLYRRVSNLTTISSIHLTTDKRYYYKLEEVVPINVKYINELDDELTCINNIQSEIWDVLWDFTTCNTKKDLVKRNSKNKEILKVLQS